MWDDKNNLSSRTWELIWKQSKCQLTDRWIKKMWNLYIQWNITQPQREENFPICNNTDGLGGR